MGGNPFTTTSIYTLIHFLERKWGIHFARGGTGALVKSLEKLMTEEGVTIETNFDVTRIEIDPQTKKVTGLSSADGREIVCDGLVFNGDPPYAYENLLPTGLKRQRLRRPDSKVPSFQWGCSFFLVLNMSMTKSPIILYGWEKAQRTFKRYF